MLMQQRHQHPSLFDSSSHPNSTPNSTFFDSQQSYAASIDPSSDFVFSNPWTGAPNIAFPQNFATGLSESDMNQPQSQDWQMFDSRSQHLMSMAQQPQQQNPHKRIRQQGRTSSNDMSPAVQHLPTPTRTPTQASLDYTHNRTGSNAMAAAYRMGVAMDRQLSGDSEMPSYSAGHSVSSYGHDSPATPRTTNGDGDETLNLNYSGKTDDDLFPPFMDESLLMDLFEDSANVQKMERTATEPYDSIMYNNNQQQFYPNFQTQKYAQNGAQYLSPFRSSMSERLQAANEARSVSPLDTSHRKSSPFRPNSPYATSQPDFNQMNLKTAAGFRQQQKAQADAYAFQQHHQRPDTSEPKTISPKETVLEYNDPANEYDAPLFPAGEIEAAYGQQPDMGIGKQNKRRTNQSNFTFIPPSIPQNAQTQDFYMPPAPFKQHASGMQDTPDFPAHLISMETSVSDHAMEPPDSHYHLGDYDHQQSQADRPPQSNANRGSYACTAPGCTRRFDSGAKLVKHKRENHGASASPSVTPQQQQQRPRLSVTAEDTSDLPDSPVPSPGTTEGVGSGMTSEALMQRNAQAGPHKCTRTNPSTGKPCNAIFSRPYDLTRHEDTIHNIKKRKVRCNLCTEDKTFSRADALTRHMRVVHPEVDFPGKHRRRHMS